jgi:Ca2+-binding RTX toxin-like protein
VVAMVGAVVVGSGVALAASITCAVNPCLGTDDPDSIQGNNNYNEVYAGASNDLVVVFGGGDTVFGDEGNDIVVGYAGQDTIYGGPDGDGSALGTSFDDNNLEGQEDSDVVYGGAGNDYIDAAFNDKPSEFPTTEPVDYSYGGGGNDHIYAADGNVDIINCGTGTRDVAIFDKGIDTTTGCEKRTGVIVSRV